MNFDLNPSLVTALEEILPSLTIWQNSTDRRIALDQIRLLCMNDPVRSLDCIDQAFENLRSSYSVDQLSAIRTMLNEQGDDYFGATPSIFVGDDCEDEFQLYAVGLLASGLTNEPLRRDLLTEEDARIFREILYKHWFNEDVCEISVFEAITQINHRLCTDTALAWDFLRDLEARRAPLVPVIDKPGYPDYAADPYISENLAAYNAEQRVLIFGVRFPRQSLRRSVMKRPYRHLGRYPNIANDDSRYFPDLIMETDYGRDMAEFLSGLGSFRYHVTEPLPFFQALSQTDHSLAPHSLLTCCSRLLMDTGYALSDIIASPATFTDPYSGYSEMRVAFARKDAPDELLAGAAVTVPFQDGAEVNFAEWYRTYERDIRRLLVSNNIPTVALENFGDRHETEPESVDRLFQSSTGRVMHLVRPSKAFEAFPTIPGPHHFN